MAGNKARRSHRIKDISKYKVNNNDEISNAVEQFAKVENNKEDYAFSRYKSWTECHNYFVKLHDDLRKNEKNYEDLSDDEKRRTQLELGYYLASWGMYRGSSFLLQYDCTIFEKVIPIILDKDYDDLWDLGIDKIKENSDDVINKLVDIRNKINLALKEYRNYFNRNKNKLANTFEEKGSKSESENISKTLVTKILLGTLCCTPAYDTYFCAAIKGHFNDFYDDDKIGNLLDLIVDNPIFDRLGKEEKYKQYPLMKIVDMAYFTIGLNKKTE